MDIINDYINWRKKRLAPRSQTEYIRDLRDLGIWLERHDLGFLNVTKLILEKYLNEVPVSKRLTNRKTSVIRSFYSYLKEHDILENNPAEKLKRLKVDKKSVTRSLTNENLVTILATLKGRNILVETIIKTFYYTGVRLSELIDMNVEDIDFDKRRITIPLGKGAKKRETKFSVNLLQQFVEYKTLWRDKVKSGEKVAWFVSQKGRRVTKGQVSYIFSKLTNKTGIHVHPHRLRHTFATHALDKGMNIEEVRTLLGHEDISTTGLYVHITESLEESYDRAFA